jgi:hypothetical protein
MGQKNGQKEWAKRMGKKWEMMVYNRSASIINQ